MNLLEVIALADFLRDRFAEDEGLLASEQPSWSHDEQWPSERARRALVVRRSRTSSLISFVARQRVRIDHDPASRLPTLDAADGVLDAADALSLALLRMEAWIYSDHPDYQDAWRP